MYRIDPKYTQQDWGAGFYEMDWDSKYKYLEKTLATQPFIVGVCRYDNQDKQTEDRALLTQDGVEVAVIKGRDWDKYSRELTHLLASIDRLKNAEMVTANPAAERAKTLDLISIKYREYYDTLYQPIIEAVAKEPELARYLPEEMFTHDKNLEEKIIEARKKVIEQNKTKGERLYSKLMKLETGQTEDDQENE